MLLVVLILIIVVAGSSRGNSVTATPSSASSVSLGPPVTGVSGVATPTTITTALGISGAATPSLTAPNTTIPLSTPGVTSQLPPSRTVTQPTTRVLWSVTVTSSQPVNVRNIPSVKGLVKRTLNPGETIDSGNKIAPGGDGGVGWIEVQWDTDNIGWVRADFVSAPQQRTVAVPTPDVAADATATAIAGDPDLSRAQRADDLHDFIFNVSCNADGKGLIVDPWCPSVVETGIKARGTQGDEAYVRTTLGTKDTAAAQSMCGAMLNWAINFDPHTRTVSVLSPTGTTISSGIVGSKRCT